MKFSNSDLCFSFLSSVILMFDQNVTNMRRRFWILKSIQWFLLHVVNSYIFFYCDQIVCVKESITLNCTTKSSDISHLKGNLSIFELSCIYQFANYYMIWLLLFMHMKKRVFFISSHTPRTDKDLFFHSIIGKWSLFSFNYSEIYYWWVLWDSWVF